MAIKFPLRIHESKVYDDLKTQSKEKKWSVNTLINSILEDHFPKPKKKTKAK